MKPINYAIESPEKILVNLNGKQARELNFLRAHLRRTRSSLVREALEELVKKYEPTWEKQVHLK